MKSIDSSQQQRRRPYRQGEEDEKVFCGIKADDEFMES